MITRPTCGFAVESLVKKTSMILTSARTVRFGENVLESMLEFTQSMIDSRVRSGMTAPDPRIVDIGTGNGVFLHRLAELGYDSHLYTFAFYTRCFSRDLLPRSITGHSKENFLPSSL